MNSGNPTKKHVLIYKMNYLDVMRARQFAIEKHDGQLYGNLPYLYHLDMVHQLAEGIGLSEIHQVVAYLHDTIEDGVSDYAEISKEFASGFKENIESINGSGWLIVDPLSAFLSSLLRILVHEFISKLIVKFIFLFPFYDDDYLSVPFTRTFTSMKT